MALVSLPIGWRVEIGSRDDRGNLMHDIAIALESSARSLCVASLPVWAGSRRYDVRPHLDIMASPVRVG